MSNVYPFKSGADVVFDSGGFEVAFGFSETSNAMRVGMRWKDSANTKAFPQVYGNPCYFEISQELDLAFLATLLGKNGVNNENIIKAMDKLSSNKEEKQLS